MNEVVALVLTYKDGSTQTITVTQANPMENDTIPAESTEEVVPTEATEAAPVEESTSEAPVEETA